MGAAAPGISAKIPGARALCQRPVAGRRDDGYPGGAGFAARPVPGTARIAVVTTTRDGPLPAAGACETCGSAACGAGSRYR
ncbi:hypothetical protein B6F55_03230 [Mycobacterium tuberculosis variant bovis]|nr:hypothetical protein B6F55_03230 [Mycobacterium tuberculosis variant bovis]